MGEWPIRYHRPLIEPSPCFGAKRSPRRGCHRSPSAQGTVVSRNMEKRCCRSLRMQPAQWIPLLTHGVCCQAVQPCHGRRRPLRAFAHEMTAHFSLAGPLPCCTTASWCHPRAHGLWSFLGGAAPRPRDSDDTKSGSVLRASQPPSAATFEDAAITPTPTTTGYSCGAPNMPPRRYRRPPAEPPPCLGAKRSPRRGHYGGPSASISFRARDGGVTQHGRAPMPVSKDAARPMDIAIDLWGLLPPSGDLTLLHGRHHKKPCSTQGQPLARRCEDPDDRKFPWLTPHPTGPPLSLGHGCQPGYPLTRLWHAVCNGAHALLSGLTFEELATASLPTAPPLPVHPPTDHRLGPPPQQQKDAHTLRAALSPFGGG